MFTLKEATNTVYSSYMRVADRMHGYDSATRHPEHSRRLLEKLNLAIDKLPAIAVTGSKGKGSTAILSAAILQACGYRVGLVTSPHLVNFNERIRLNGVAISDADFCRIMTEIAPAIAEIDAELQGTLEYVGPNGVILAAALKYFTEQGVEILVLEAGRGGRYDEISLVQNKVACFTPIMAEHLDKLGPTVADVAWNKAGLLKVGGAAVSAPQTPEVRQILAQEILELNAKLLVVGTDFEYVQEFLEQGQSVTVRLENEKFSFELPTHVRFQGQNAAVALAAVAELVGVEKVRQSFQAERLRNLRLAGRSEIISQNPLVLVDGAINRDSAREFFSWADKISPSPVVLVTSLPADKDFRGVLQTLSMSARTVIVTQASNINLHFDHAAVIEAAREFFPDVVLETNVNVAFAEGLRRVGSHGTLWSVGTQSLVRDALLQWKSDYSSIWL
jgi:dihydrofolate synthase / folylpolyglutamate synthase